jgi:NADPH:quinone reductase-like Zn-dependent oxidoreductase
MQLKKDKWSMKAIGLTQYLPIDDPSSLMDVALPTPVPGERDLLVRVEAISVNPVDCKVRISKAGITEATLRVLGWDAAGVLEAVGSEAVLFKTSDEVFYAGSITRHRMGSIV